MKLKFDTRLVDSILRACQSTEPDFSGLYADPVFAQLKAQAEEFQQCKLACSEYLEQLLYINGMNMREHMDEIIRNRALILSVDCEKVVEETCRYLDAEAVEAVDVITAYLMPGIAGLAMEDYIVIDPSPCTWFAADGSDTEKYINRFVIPTLRHELHHVVCYRIHGKTAIRDIRNVGELAEDYAHELQLEGGAILCERQDACGRLSEQEDARLDEAIAKYSPVWHKWLENDDADIEAADWSDYYELWGGKQACILDG